MATTTRDAASTGPIANASRPSQNRSERIGRATRLGVDFETFVSTFRRALVSEITPLETIVADRVILAAWRLQLASALEFETAFAGDALPPVALEAVDAERGLSRALDLLETSRAARLGRDDRPAPEPAEAGESLSAYVNDNDDDDFDFNLADYSNECPTLPDDDRDAADGTAITPRWQERLIFDFNVSETSPVVKGTWVTVGHVVSLIVDGWSWSDVLRTHPELTEDDIRTCLAYTVEQDDSGGF